jgi:ribose transport system permease protein
VNRALLLSLVREHTTILVLVGLCAVLSIATWDEQFPTGARGGQQVAALVKSQAPPPAKVLIVVRNTQEDAAFASAAAERLSLAGYEVVETVRGQPSDARRAFDRLSEAGQRIQVIAANDVTAAWTPLRDLKMQGTAVREARLFVPPSYHWPNFLKVGNLMNIANQIAFIAIIAIGMTLVIISGGIDLSVGSLVALTAMIAARLIRDHGGGSGAGQAGITACCAAAIIVGGCAGVSNGALVAIMRIPPFIVTLATMSMAAGLAFMISHGESINEVPKSIGWLSSGTLIGEIPNSVLWMGLLYGLAHLVMSRTTFGRHLYALGGNRRAAWLCGLPVRRVEMAAYAISGALAGLAGVLMLSQYASASPNYGVTYELQVIAAVVVGGTSLSGGRGTIFGTLLGALLIAVVQNGMNLMGLSSDPQKVVLGLVILAAAVVDRLKQTGGDESA